MVLKVAQGDQSVTGFVANEMLGTRGAWEHLRLIRCLGLGCLGRTAPPRPLGDRTSTPWHTQ